MRQPLTLRDRAACQADYEQLMGRRRCTPEQQRSGCSYVDFQNALLAPNADDYVRELWRSSPDARRDVQDQLAVVTGVSCSSSSNNNNNNNNNHPTSQDFSVGFHIAQELALQCGMHVILLGKSATSLERCVAQMRAEAVQRTTRRHPSTTFETTGTGTSGAPGTQLLLPKLYTCKFQPSSLQSVEEAADFCESMARMHHDRQIAVLVNAATVGCSQARLTEDGIEYNVGCNWIAAHYLTRRLAPLLLLRAANNNTSSSSAATNYKPRVILTSSIGHALGRKFNPSRFIQCPQEGGAPPGYLVWNNETGTLTEAGPCQSQTTPSLTERLWSILTNYGSSSSSSSEPASPLVVAEEPDWHRVGTQVGRSKMAVLADAMHMAKLYPQLCITSHHPGLLCTPQSTNKSESNNNEDDDDENKRLHRLTPSQAARAALRAALDPEFNSMDNNNNNAATPGAYYLHCDGQPWHPCHPTARNRTTGEPIEWEDYCAAVYQAAELVLDDLGFAPSMDA